MNIMYSLFLLLCMFVFLAPLSSDVHVRGYQKPNGTFVDPYIRTNPNHTTSDNWSTKGNINPYTSMPGTKNP